MKQDRAQKSSGRHGGLPGDEGRLRTGGTHPRPMGASLAPSPFPRVAEGTGTGTGPPGRVAATSHFTLNLPLLGAAVMTAPTGRTAAQITEPGGWQPFPSQPPPQQGFAPEWPLCVLVCAGRGGVVG